MILDKYFFNELVSSVKYNKDKQEIFMGDNEDNFIRVLDELIKNKVICSSDVSLFDSQGKRVVEELLGYYKENIMLLPESYREKITNALFNYDLSVAIDLTNMDSSLKDYIDEIIGYDCNKDPDDVDYKKLNRVKLRMKEIIIQGIVDYISGMSDEYAKEKYKEIHSIC